MLRYYGAIQICIIMIMMMVMMMMMMMIIIIIRWHRSLKVIIAYSDKWSRNVVRLHVCMSDIVMHPANAGGRNEMPFGKDSEQSLRTLVWSQITLY